MRFLLLSKADLFGNAILNLLLPALRPGHEVAVCLSDRIFRNERGFPATDRFMYYTRDFLLERFFPVLDAGLDGQMGELLTFARLGERHGAAMTLLGGDPVAACEVLRKITADFDPGVILCCRHDFIVPPDVFSRPAFGSYNLHSGAVPWYRGPFCSFWSMMNRETMVGCSIHALKEKVDTGDIIATVWTTIDYNRSLIANLLNIYAAGVELFLKEATHLHCGPLAGVPQPTNGGRYYQQPDARDYEEFSFRGGRLIDAGENADIYRRYLPAGVSLDELFPGWKWEREGEGE